MRQSYSSKSVTASDKEVVEERRTIGGHSWLLLADVWSSRGGEADMAVISKPIACTLAMGELGDRLTLIATLNRNSLRGCDRAESVPFRRLARNAGSHFHNRHDVGSRVRQNYQGYVREVAPSF